MVMLEAAMAFAVTMIIFSTITTGIVEIVHRITGIRSTQLRVMAEKLFEDYIWPRLQHRLAASPTDTAKSALAKEFVEQLTESPLGKSNEIGRILGMKVGAVQKIEKLTPLGFAERLARTKAGQAILAEGEAHLEQLVTDFSRSFDRLGRIGTEFLQIRARIVSILVGIALALVANIEASRLIGTLLDNPDLRTTLIEQADEAAKENKAAAEELQALIDQVNTGTVNKDTALEALNQSIETIRANVTDAQSTGLPIGSGFFPHTCILDPTSDPSCGKTGVPWVWEIVKWAAMCILSGFLIGLGGPFWYQVFQRLSQLTQVIRSLGLGGKKGAAADETADRPAPEDSAKPTSVVDAFKVAATVKQQSDSSLDGEYMGPAWRPAPIQTNQSAGES